MTAKAYYITTLGDWQRHAARFAGSHYVTLGAAGDVCAHSAAAAECVDATPGVTPEEKAEADPSSRKALCRDDNGGGGRGRPNAAARILVLVEADEGVHNSLEDDAAFEALPHPLAAKPISAAAQSVLVAHGVAPGATMFDAAETLARVHPLLRHRVF